MKSISLNTLLSQFLRDRKHARDIRHPSMKCGVETCHLLSPGEMFLRETDDRQSRWRMQRRKSGRSVQPLQHRFIDQAMLTQVWTAVNDTVSDGNGRGHFAVRENLPDPDNRIPLGRNGYCLAPQGIGIRILNVESATSLTDQFRYAGKQHLSP